MLCLSIFLDNTKITILVRTCFSNFVSTFSVGFLLLLLMSFEANFAVYTEKEMLFALE